ncbi:MAG: radical SAM protein [Kiritimatiellae bacterium]|nr:radical SAM protein [Kiritimatiellia bacterium]
MKYLFGPVPSRRYGRSLGVDLTVPKTCTLNCRFCQLGPTRQTTVERTDTPPVSEILSELRGWIAAGGEADFVTASGSGEPTLHRHFGEIFRWTRGETPFSTLLLSNGTLFDRRDVRADAALADVVKVSLHAWDQASFEAVNRPHPSLRFDAILDGYRAFRQMFGGRLDVEVFVIPGVNDATWQMERIAALAKGFAPDSVTLNTAVRPPADDSVRPCPRERLAELADLFEGKAHVSGNEPKSAKGKALTADELAGLVERHPLPLADLAAQSGCTESEIRDRLAPLCATGRIRLFESGGRIFAGPNEPSR